MGFALGGDGSLWILDQVNGRVLRLRPGQTKPEVVQISLLGAQDIKVAADGTVLVLDRLGDKAVSLIGADGRPVGTLSLAKIKDSGGITGVFTDGDAVYVEREHGALTHVGTTKGVQAELPSQILGRPTPDGRAFMNASLSNDSVSNGDHAAVVVSVFDRKQEAQRFTRLISFSEPIQYVIELDADRAGTLYLGVVLGLPGNTHIVVTCLSLSDGRTLGRVDLPASTLADEVFREIAVDPEGGFVHAVRTDTGARYERHSCE